MRVWIQRACAAKSQPNIYMGFDSSIRTLGSHADSQFSTCLTLHFQTADKLYDLYYTYSSANDKCADEALAAVDTGKNISLQRQGYLAV